MELIAGSSLQDHLSLIKDTHQKLTEEQIWRVFIQLILALRYLHKEKGIVHRDITANNIMLDDEYRVKLSKYSTRGLWTWHSESGTRIEFTTVFSFISRFRFGQATRYRLQQDDVLRRDYVLRLPRNHSTLALQWKSRWVSVRYLHLQSTCFHLDIWSLGCVLYHMVALVPPFFTANILSLASKICDSSYDVDPLNYYSDRVGHIVTKCLTIDPVNRPDINGVSLLCMEQLMSYTDRSCATIQSLERRLRHREHQRELQLIRQHPQYNQRCFSCSSAKESLVSSSNGLPDVSFDGLDGQHDAGRHDLNHSGTLNHAIDQQTALIFIQVPITN